VVVLLVFLPSSLRIAFWDGLQANKLLTGMLFLFCLLAISLVWSTGQQVDSWTFLLFNVRGSRPIWLDRIMSGFTQLGHGITSLGISLVLFLVSNHQLAYEFMLGTLILWLIVEMMKFLIHRSRPYIRLTQARIVGFRARGRSFPSGHTVQVFFMATFVVHHFNVNFGVAVLLYTIALIVGITRVYVGAHYPRDVLAGAILGSAWGLIGAIVQ